MTSTTRPAQETAATTPLPRFAAIALIVVALCLAYANSLNGGYLFDDVPSIPENLSIRHLSDLSAVLSPPHGEGITVEGRPILNLSFAVNFALGGSAVQGYHALNLAIHILASLFLFGIVRRLLGVGEKRYQADAVSIACAAALLWGLHPLQTESVSYLVQRAESLMGLFFLGSLYALLRANETLSPTRWYVLSVMFAFFAVGTKEVAVTLPVIAILFDRTFLSGSFKKAWQKRHGFYLALSASWILSALLVVSAGSRGGTIGPKSGVSSWGYGLSQSRAIFHYLRLVVWPHPLVMDYGTNFVSLGEALPWAAMLILILGAVAFLLAKRPIVGFFGAWFFVILSPTSSFIGGTRQMMAEHRLYLSLAAIAVGCALLAYRFLGRKGLVACVLMATVLGVAAFTRNKAYHDSLSIYEDTALNRPQNAWARYNLGKTLDESGHPGEAIGEYSAAVKMDPEFYQAHFNWGNALLELGKPKEAILQFQEAIRAKPNYPKAEYNLGNALISAGDLSGSLEHFQRALSLKPDYIEAEDNLGTALLNLGRPLEAIDAFQASLKIDPNEIEAHYNLGGAFLTADKPRDAAAEYAYVLKLNPGMPEARHHLGNALEAEGLLKEAVDQYRTALRLQPGDAAIQADLDRALRSH